MQKKTNGAISGAFPPEGDGGVGGLDFLITAWPAIAKPVRDGILAMVQACLKHEEGEP